MTIDFHTCTSLFSNCGSRRLALACCPDRHAGGKHRTDHRTDSANRLSISFVTSLIVSVLLVTASLAALRPAMPSRSAGDTGRRLTASSIFGMLPI